MIGGIGSVISPGGDLEISLLMDGGLGYRVVHRGAELIASSRLGVLRADASFESGMRLVGVSDPTTIDRAYQLPHGKKRVRREHGVERIFRFEAQLGGLLDVVVRAHNDGVAFRYRFPELTPGPVTVTSELTTFSLARGGKAWMQPFQTPGQFAPAYENFYADGIPIGTGTTSPGWCFPALFNTRDKWLLITESDLDAGYVGSRLVAEAGDATYRVAPPLPAEGEGLGAVEPVHRLPWLMPWRVIVVGAKPGEVAESDLIDDLATPTRFDDVGWVRPGRVSWSWWSDHDSPKDLPSLYLYIDLAERMGWEYTLVDANWDCHPEAEMRRFVESARARGVGVFLWYNSGGPHNTVAERPRDRMHSPDVRREEMAKLVDWGVAGIKVDFFHSDKQDSIDRYLGILEDAAAHRLMVNFHGCTVPRGWSRTWPNLMSMEAVRGAEAYTFDPEYAAEAPRQHTILPFTRNVVGPMDYTPVTFSHHAHGRRTTDAHELALAVVFESGLLHLADSADIYLGLAEEVRSFLAAIPAAWDETRVLDGEPGRYVVVARRRNHEWWIGGVNGRDTARRLSVDTGFASGYKGTLLVDGGPGIDAGELEAGGIIDIEMAPFGGFAVWLCEKA